jgi:NAD(P)-dependent dehydrogenase (short-subunit alcohol dehydrogenase family)
MVRKLEGKTTIITGISNGIGRATAILFAQEGSNIIGADLDIEQGKIVTEILESKDINVIFVKADISNSEDVEVLFQKTREVPRVDILFNNVGIEVVKKLEETSEEEWNKAIDINLKSVFLCTSRVISEMRKAGGGVIINNSSAAGLVGSFSPVYSATKGAIISLTKSLAVELAPDNIRVNCICPGAIETPMLHRVIEKQGDPEIIRKKRLKNYPLGRFGTPDEIASTVLFLASEESSFITGTAIVIDGGFTSH